MNSWNIVHFKEALGSENISYYSGFKSIREISLNIYRREGSFYVFTEATQKMKGKKSCNDRRGSPNGTKFPYDELDWMTLPSVRWGKWKFTIYSSSTNKQQPCCFIIHIHIKSFIVPDTLVNLGPSFIVFDVNL